MSLRSPSAAAAVVDVPTAVTIIERARTAWDLRYDEIALAIGADESTLHRWRARATSPSRVFRARLAILNTLISMVEGQEQDESRGAHEWLLAPHPFLGGYTPRAMLTSGRLELVLAAVSLPSPTPGAAAPSTRGASQAAASRSAPARRASPARRRAE